MATMTFGQYARMMQERADSCQGAIRDATTKATDLVHAESKAIMNRDIYSKPEDRTGMSWSDKHAGEGYVFVQVEAGGRLRKRKVEHIGTTLAAYVGDNETIVGGRKKWRRTGNLRTAEKAKVLSPYTGVVDNAMAYALPRHNLGYGPASPEAIDPKPKRAKHTTREAPFRTQAIKATARARFEVYKAAWHYVLFR